MLDAHTSFLSIFGTFGDATDTYTGSVSGTDATVHDTVGAGGVRAGWFAILLPFFLGGRQLGGCSSSIVAAGRRRIGSSGLCHGGGTIIITAID